MYSGRPIPIFPGMMLPSLFISHGAPTLAVEPGPAQDFLRRLGTDLPRPKSILAVSAHWESDPPSLGTTDRPRTIHDFGGFGPALHAMQYPAPGAPALATRAAALLAAEGMAAVLDPARGLDHGAWVPLSLMYPDADIPVTQLSVQPHAGADHHLRVGRALAALRAEGVLILASGSTTHDLRAIDPTPDAPEPDWVKSFADWIERTLAADDDVALAAYRRLAPNAIRNHPTEEHILPLFVARGAGGSAAQLYRGLTYGVLRMDAYAFS